MKTEKLRPMDCENLTDVLSLNKSASFSGDYSLLVQHDGAVVITKQKMGEHPEAAITIPRSHFLRLVEFYQTEQIGGAK